MRGQNAALCHRACAQRKCLKSIVLCFYVDRYCGPAKGRLTAMKLSAATRSDDTATTPAVRPAIWPVAADRSGPPMRLPRIWPGVRPARPGSSAEASAHVRLISFYCRAWLTAAASPAGRTAGPLPMRACTQVSVHSGHHDGRRNPGGSRCSFWWPGQLAGSHRGGQSRRRPAFGLEDGHDVAGSDPAIVPGRPGERGMRNGNVPRRSPHPLEVFPCVQ
jgi:hypothetical protein